jgi:hypothetical protein
MPIDDNGILQTDATIIAGVLILLTIATVGLETRLFSNLFTLMFTIVAIFPFAVSAMFIIDTKHNGKEKAVKNSQKARNLTVSGFTYLLGAVIVIVVANLYEVAGPTKSYNGTDTTSSIAMHCTKDPTAFNIIHLSECGKFTPGSIAEDCASRPRFYNLNLSQCSELLEIFYDIPLVKETIKEI